MGVLQSRLASFRYAWRGLVVLVFTQANARIHLAAALSVTALGVAAGLSSIEWCVLSLSVALVWIAEALNTAIEFLADAAVPERHALIEKSKDIAAGAVLIAALNAVVVGAVIFGVRGAAWQRVDSCLDGGGCWDYLREACEAQDQSKCSGSNPAHFRTGW